VQGELHGIEGVAVAALGVGVAGEMAAFFADEAEIFVDVTGGGQGEAVVFECGDEAFAEELFEGEGRLAGARVGGGGGSDDAFDGDEGGEGGADLAEVITFVGGIEAQAPGASAAGAGVDQFDNAADALEGEFLVGGFPDEDEAGEIVGAGFFDEGERGGVAGLAFGGGDVPAEADHSGGQAGPEPGEGVVEAGVVFDEEEFATVRFATALAGGVQEVEGDGGGASQDEFDGVVAVQAVLSSSRARASAGVMNSPVRSSNKGTWSSSAS